MFWILNGDLASVFVDAVVVTDDPSGFMKGEAANAVKQAGGREIEEQSIEKGPFQLGDAWVTEAGSLGIRHVIHTASITLDGETNSDILEKAVRSSLRVADELQLRTVAFPALGTGLAGFGVEACAEIMCRTFASYWHSRETPAIGEVLFVLFGDGPYKAFKSGVAKSEVFKPSH